MEIRIKVAKQDDRWLIGKICRETIPLYDEFLPGFFESQGTYLEKVLPDGYDFYIIEVEGDGAGFVCSKKLNEGVIYIAMLYFLPKYYRQGIGSKVMNIMENHFKIKGFKYITLLAHKKAFWANDFYIKNGFRIKASNKQEAEAILGGVLGNYYFNGTSVMVKAI